MPGGRGGGCGCFCAPTQADVGNGADADEKLVVFEAINVDGGGHQSRLEDGRENRAQRGVLLVLLNQGLEFQGFYVLVSHKLNDEALHRADFDVEPVEEKSGFSEHGGVTGNFGDRCAEFVFSINLEVGDVDGDVGLEGLKLAGGGGHRFAQFGDAVRKLAGGGGEFCGALIERLHAPDDTFHGGLAW